VIDGLFDYSPYTEYSGYSDEPTIKAPLQESLLSAVNKEAVQHLNKPTLPLLLRNISSIVLKTDQFYEDFLSALQVNPRSGFQLHDNK